MGEAAPEFLAPNSWLLKAPKQACRSPVHQSGCVQQPYQTGHHPACSPGGEDDQPMLGLVLGRISKLGKE